MSNVPPDIDAQSRLDSMIGTRWTIAAGYLVVVVFFLILLLWGGTIPLSTAAIAPGIVGVEGHKKQIQHLEGGIVSEIHVRDGDIVEAGEILLTLHDVEIKSRYEELNDRYIQLTAEYARWIAEQDSTSVIQYPDSLLGNPDKSRIQSAIGRQNEIMLARRAVTTEALSNLEHQMNQVDEEDKAAKVRMQNLARKLRLVNAELGEFRQLEKRGMITRSQLFDLQKDVANLQLEIGDSQSVVNLSTQKKAQIMAQIAELKNSGKQESAENAAQVRAELQTLRQKMTAVKNQLDRTKIPAPISGYVINSVVNTKGGVVLAGDLIMEIMPKNERLLIESKVSPKDRDSVRVGQSAEVRFSAFSRRSTMPVAGVVKLISADSIIDPVTQVAYYSTTIKLTEDPTEALNGASIFPGMQADVLIVTGAQTFLQYLASPVARSFNRAFREE